MRADAEASFSAAPPLWLQNGNPALFLRRAEDLLAVALQPIVDIRAGRVFGYESLVRNVDALGLESIPALFDHAHRIGVLAKLEMILTDKALAQFALLCETKDWTRLFVNLDGRSMDHATLRPELERLVARHGFKPADICIELSEQNQTLDGAGLDAVLQTLRDGGFQIAIDDFGAGFSGLKMLYESNPDYIKIDRFFVSSLQSDAKKRLFIGSVVEIAHTLGIKVISEGVETECEHHGCRELGCDLLQGYYVARPTLDLGQLLPCYDIVAQDREDRLQDAHRTLRQLIEPCLCLTEGASLAEVLALFEAAPGQSVAPVLDKAGAPVGGVREIDLKPYVYSRFGRELLTNRSLGRRLSEFIRPIPTADVNASVSRLIDVGASAAEDGVILTENMRYLGYLPAAALVKLANSIQIGEIRRQNPLTHLPGNEAIREHLADALGGGLGPRLFAYFDFDNFKPFNDSYGFRAGDRAILMFADMLRSSFLGDGVFLGHVGGDDFFLGVEGEACARTAAQLKPLCERFRREAESLYSEADRAAGCSTARNRNGQIESFPLLSCSVGALWLAPQASALTVEALSQKLAETKQAAKRSTSGYAEARIEAAAPAPERIAETA